MIVVRNAVVAAALTAASAVSLAQAPAFEVASVKPTATTATTGPAALRSFRVSPSGIVSVTNYSLRDLVALAYGIDRTYEKYSPEGGPAALLSTRFDINARMPADAAAQTAAAQSMLRTLLAERFKLRTHAETRQVPVYALTAAREGRLGPELRPSQHDCDAYGAARRQGTVTEAPRDAKGRVLCTTEIVRAAAPDPASGLRPIAAQVSRAAGPLTRLLPGIQGFLDRPVLDATGLTGNFEWQLTSAMPGTRALEHAPMSTALEEQLGLELEPRTSPVEVIVIDSVEAPSPN